MVKNLPASAGDIRDAGSIPGSGRSPGGGHSNPLQYPCLENRPGQRSLAGYSPQGHRVGDDRGDLAQAAPEELGVGKQTSLQTCRVRAN